MCGYEGALNHSAPRTESRLPEWGGTVRLDALSLGGCGACGVGVCQRSGGGTHVAPTRNTHVGVGEAVKPALASFFLNGSLSFQPEPSLERPCFLVGECALGARPERAPLGRSPRCERGEFVTGVSRGG